MRFMDIKKKIFFLLMLFLMLAGCGRQDETALSEDVLSDAEDVLSDDGSVETEADANVDEVQAD